MKLQSPSRFTSFYESFSDLIFATMAIFILLMLIFLVQVNVSTAETVEPKDVEKIEKQLQQAQQKLEDIVQVHPVELVIAVDVSGSMGPTADNLRQAVRQIALLVPKLVEEMRIGIVVYQTKRRVFPEKGGPLHLLRARSDDGGASFGELEEWMQQWLDLDGDESRVEELGPSRVNIVDAVDTSLDLFSPPADERVRQVFVLMGDVGPWEREVPLWVLDQRDRERAERILSEVSAWKGRGDHRYVVTHYAKSNTLELLENPKTRSFHKLIRGHMPKTATFFRGLATEADTGKRYSESWEDVLVHVLDAMLQENDN